VPLVARTTEQDKVRELQRTLYRAAKADPGRRFHALYDKVLRRDVLERAWEVVRANRGAAGIDRQTLADVERYGISRLLDELAVDLKDGSYRPLAARRVFIAKPGSQEWRPLSIPTVRDRIVQTAIKIVVEPIFEADFVPCSFGFRPRRSAHDALQVLVDEAWRGPGRRWVLETDIADCFGSIPRDRLVAAVQERIVDRHVLKLLRVLLRAGAVQDGVLTRSVTGTPQGGPLSPVLCNVYLHRLDRDWRTRGVGVLVRYADDLVVMCRTKAEAERARVALTALLAELGLELKAAKTRIVHLSEGGEGLDFLGFHHRWVRARAADRRHIAFLARWPSRKAMQHARDRIREITLRRRLLVPVEQIVRELNQFLRGWAGYFRYGNSTRQLDMIRLYAVDRLARFIAKRHKRSWRYGWKVVAFQSSDCLGLVSLHGIVVAPRPNRPWREKPHAGGERRR
jgi:group II intron reverse transcriptase/maturase